ncbi:MAG TPA: hypothetical protein VMF09_12125 [Solirubrobacteraceae bacterium]|nr:hypothetical protein [Solirubrobacteraceae bacterium]
MPRILVLADCESELGERPVMIGHECDPRPLDDRQAALRVLDRAGSAVAEAHELEERVSALCAA